MGEVLLQDSLNVEKYTAMQADHVTGAPTMMDNDHAYIHQGKAYTASYYGTSTGAINFLLTTPASTVTYPYVHFRPIALTSDKEGVVLKIIEDSTKANSTAAGAAITFYNKNRNSSLSAGSVLSGGTSTVAPSGSTSGDQTLLATYYAGGGSGQGQTTISAPIEGIHEWVLKPGTKYHFKITTPATTKIGASFFIYEESLG